MIKTRIMDMDLAKMFASTNTVDMSARAKVCQVRFNLILQLVIYKCWLIFQANLTLN